MEDSAVKRHLQGHPEECCPNQVSEPTEVLNEEGVPINPFLDVSQTKSDFYKGKALKPSVRQFLESK
jgi:hypothetical protein